MSLLKTLLPPLLLAVLTAGQVFYGACPDIPAVTDFSYQSFAYGRGGGEKPKVWFWHKQRGVLLHPNRKCCYEYHFPLDNGRDQFFRQYVWISDRKTYRMSGMAKPVQNGVARLNITHKYDDATTPYFNSYVVDIIATDYDNYAIGLYCHTFLAGDQQKNLQILLIYVRARQVTNNVENEIERMLTNFANKYGLSKANMTIVNKDCQPPPKKPCVEFSSKKGFYERCTE